MPRAVSASWFLLDEGHGEVVVKRGRFFLPAGPGRRDI
jgi:hypothetical protein